jgi:hypothetical protein
MTSASIVGLTAFSIPQMPLPGKSERTMFVFGHDENIMQWTEKKIVNPCEGRTTVMCVKVKIGGKQNVDPTRGKTKCYWFYAHMSVFPYGK